MFDGKNLAYVNVPLKNHSEEEKYKHSLRRKAEVDEVVDVLRKIIQKNSSKRMSIGILSFYKEQVKLLQETVSKEFSMDDPLISISCGTVDSYQGKEFDIVILSGVRANGDGDLGFIQYSSSRVNVALSRAKRLLVFIGHIKTYSSNEHFSNLFARIREKGWYSE